MTAVYDETDREWSLGHRIGGGGEGEVYRLQGAADYCAKIYTKRPITLVQEQKLRALQALYTSLQSVAALPLSVLYAASGKRGAIGMVLPYVEGLDVHDVYHPEGRSRHLPGADLRFLISVAKNIAFVFQQLHGAGIVVGDISEQNVRVLKNATVRLIDCDSFQVSSNGRRFECGVGSVLWTPSELQGKSLAGVVRTENHDRFGLAQLIFLLLFCGRYPFAGTPVGNANLDPGQAIARHAFAYDPDPPVRLLSAPRNAPPFGSYPSWIRSLFIRAFGAGSERAGARPTPLEWIDALEKLMQNLESCGRVSSHSFWSGLLQCPWCEMAAKVGIDWFPSTENEGGLPQAGHSKWSAEGVFLLPKISFSPISELRLNEALEHAKLRRKVPWFRKNLLKIEWLRQFLWQAERPHIEARLKQTEKDIREIEFAAENLFAQCRDKMEKLRLEAQQVAALMQNPDLIRKHSGDRVENEVRRKALEKFLYSLSLSNLQVKGLGKVKLETLVRHGVSTVADLRRERLEGLPAFGKSMIQKLLDTRAQIESRFQFERTAAAASRIEARVAGEIRDCMAALKRRMLQFEADAKSLKQEYERQMHSLSESHEALAVNREILRRELE
jgi:DNA-binding helix-hairpin-helix protein with protein kinase domain